MVYEFSICISIPHILPLTGTGQRLFRNGHKTNRAKKLHSSPFHERPFFLILRERPKKIFSDPACVNGRNRIITGGNRCTRSVQIRNRSFAAGIYRSSGLTLLSSFSEYDLSVIHKKYPVFFISDQSLYRDDSI